MLIDPPITESWRTRGGETREAAWDFSVRRVAKGRWGLVFICESLLSFNLKLGVMGLLKLWKDSRDRRVGGRKRQCLSPWQRGKMSEGKSLRPWQCPWCACLFYVRVCVCVDINMYRSMFVWVCMWMPELKVWLLRRGGDHRASFLNCR